MLYRFMLCIIFLWGEAVAKSKIEWTDKVWNPVTGCSKISAGCDNCYAERMSKRFAETWGLSPDNPFKVTLHPERLEQPLRWKKPSKIFVCSMSDLFHDDVPFDFLQSVLGIIWFSHIHNFGHTFMILTKRPERMKDFFENKIHADSANNYHLPQNLWLGVTAENQEQADKRIPILLETPAAVRFVSVEPMLGPVDLWYPKSIWPDGPEMCCTGRDCGCRGLPTEPPLIYGLNWVICGGESGPGARPMHPYWARSLRDQCQAAGVPYFFKQWGEWESDLPNYAGPPLPPERVHWIWPDGTHKQVGCGEVSPGNILTHRVGKKAAGSLLDGQEWKQFPGERE
ncbi:MAG: DUF5131 family protein [Sporomusa sp.]